MSAMLQALLFEKHQKARLTIKELAEEIDRKEGTIYNQISAGKFEIPTYVEGNKRFADLRDVVTFLDEQRKGAA